MPCPSYLISTTTAIGYPFTTDATTIKNRKPLGASPLTQRLLETLQNEAAKRRKIEEKFKSVRKSCRQTGITQSSSPSSALVRRSPLWSGSFPEVIIPSDHAH